jgi:hypothetical protein
VIAARFESRALGAGAPGAKTGEPRDAAAYADGSDVLHDRTSEINARAAVFQRYGIHELAGEDRRRAREVWMIYTAVKLSGRCPFSRRRGFSPEWAARGALRPNCDDKHIAQPGEQCDRLPRATVLTES